MSQRPEPPPEGALIKATLKRHGKSARKAAQEAGISEGRWRQIADGYQVISAGNYAPVKGPAETVARMASVAGVSPEELEIADRHDAARELRTLQAAELREAPTLPPHLGHIKDPSPAEAAMLQYLAAMQEQIRVLDGKIDAMAEREREESENGAHEQKGA